MEGKLQTALHVRLGQFRGEEPRVIGTVDGKMMYLPRRNGAGDSSPVTGERT